VGGVLVSADVIDLQAAREERLETYEAPMVIAAASDFDFGISNQPSGRFAVVIRKDGAGYGMAFTESEARQFARELLETANVIRAQRAREEGTPA
jgi:hypothetical protein